MLTRMVVGWGWCGRDDGGGGVGLRCLQSNFDEQDPRSRFTVVVVCPPLQMIEEQQDLTETS